MRRGKARAAQIGVRAHAHDRAALLVDTDEHGNGCGSLTGGDAVLHLLPGPAVEIAAEQDVSAGTVFSGLSGGVRVRTACKEQLRSLLLKGKLFGVSLSGGLLLLLERRLRCFGLCLPGGRRFRLRRLARCTRGKAECQQQRKSKVFSYGHNGSSS